MKQLKKGGLAMRKLAGFGTVASLFAVTAWLLTGCATVFKGTHNDVVFNSDPIEVDVYVNGHLMGATPVELKLESKKTYHIEFKKEGFETRTFTITNHVGVGWVILDLICGLAPVIIDAATGAWYVLDQENVDAILREQQ